MNRDFLQERFITWTWTVMSKLQCDQIGLFLKSLGNKYAYKISPNILWLFGLLWERPFYVKLLCLLFWATLGKLRHFFISTSGHTAQDFHSAPKKRFLPWLMQYNFFNNRILPVDLKSIYVWRHKQVYLSSLCAKQLNID